ncbi:MAG: SNF2-related protein [Bacteroidales bacterium]|nr:SNF2-related protein [Bacteroidales bacterium]
MRILDNINDLWGDDLKLELRSGSKLKVAASCFSIYAYESLKKELERVDSLEFIFTASAFLPSQVTDKAPRERREFHIPRLERERNLYGSEFEIQLKNKLTQRAIARECANWIKRKANFRSNATKAPMQQFACLEAEGKTVAYTPIHGFTAVDLGYQQGDAVSNFINKMDDAPFANSYMKLFDQIWDDEVKLVDVTEAICRHIESVYQENSPEKIYFLMLYNIFNEFLENLNDDVLPNDLTGYKESAVWNKLFNFQQDAATGIINKLENYNGCILADSVGLGKTFTALAVIKYYELRNKSVLVLCPKKLSDNWRNYNCNLKTNILAADRLNYDVLCHTDLLRTSGESFGIPLNKVNWGNYDLVVIDESHNFRNSGRSLRERETRYQRLMRSVIREGVKTKVLMLSATPVNNRFSDLRNQLALAYEGDSDKLAKKLETQSSIEDIFRNAQTVFNRWSKLPPEERTAKAILEALDFDFFELLDSVTIARSRKHIERYYDTSEIGKFPERLKPLSFRPPLTNRTDIIKFNEIYEELIAVKQAVYAPINYVFPSRLSKYEEQYDTSVDGGRGKLRQVDRELALQKLMTVNLLKRLESSVAAFKSTLQALRERLTEALDKIEQYESSPFHLTSFEFSEPDEMMAAEDEELYEAGFSIGNKVKVDLADMDLVSWKQDLNADLAIITGLWEEISRIAPADDAKLQHLKAHILQKIESPLNPGNRKVLLFTAFADTANYLYDNLSRELKSQKIHTARVSGSDGPKSTLGRSYDFQSLLTLFSPLSKDKELILPDETREIDLLIGTDCISEGQNLQDCDYLINYDIHWNPVRIIQRFGRIDRIGSPNNSIQLVNYWPDISLDEYINLKERVENRMHIVDISSTGDDNVLSGKANDISFRTEQLRRLQSEVIEMEDLKTGVNITDLGLNDFRMDLLGYMKANGDLGSLPNGLHAVLPPRPEIGLVPGVIFTLRNRNSEVKTAFHNRLHPYYLVYISQSGNVITDHSQVKALLDLARAGCKGLDAPLHDVCRAFNTETNDGRDMQRYSGLLDAAIRSMVEIKEEKDIDSLFAGTKTSAMEDGIRGLDDFELVAFLVIMKEEY